ncbi:Hypothetical predicted protein [Mytilus galloprovincialis]|uniref:Uncharacterized protein n=1 Tax=Mytilus galloprovincialis TaxID=29158 RepID=A0A8B6FLN6_MYTGA|nr:Hypothetical predicted protein [Mytilus galloprovincialis]
MFEDYSSDKLIILILNHKQECPGKQVRSATPETSRDHIQETSIKIEVEGLSENYEDKTVQHLKATNGSEDPTISFESVDPTISYESVEKGSIIIWGRISKAFCYARTSVADVVEGFLGSFFISYPIETNDAVDITVKVGVVINEGNDLDDEGDCILCGKCKSEFIKVSQYISHQRTECKLRQLGKKKLK